MAERNKVDDVMPAPSTRRRKWEVFPGRNQFCFDGRIMRSRKMGIFYFTVFLVFGTSGCFFAFDGRHLWSSVSPAIPIFAALQMIFVASTLCRTGFGDPGIIPRATPAEVLALDEMIEENNRKRRANGEPQQFTPPRIKPVCVKGLNIDLKYCPTCRIFRPPRASHCSVCDNCVDKFDHHCPWVGNCIGRRNYKYFYLFLTSASFYCLYLLAVSILSIVLNAQNAEGFKFEDVLKQSPLSIVVILVAFFSLISAGGMGCYHTHLVAMAATTNEEIKKTFERSSVGNPFAVGNCCMNFIDVICGVTPPSLLDNRGWVEHDVESASEAADTSTTEYGQSQNWVGATFGPFSGNTHQGITATREETLPEDQPLTPNLAGGDNSNEHPSKYPPRLPPLQHSTSSQLS